MRPSAHLMPIQIEKEVLQGDAHARATFGAKIHEWCLRDAHQVKALISWPKDLSWTPKMLIMEEENQL